MATDVLQKAVGSSPTEMTDSQVFDNGSSVGVGTNSPSAKVHVVAASEQMRLGYDASNYVAISVGSAGEVDVNAVSSALEVTLSLNGNERMHMFNNNVQWDLDSIPTIDNTYKCGAASQRWSLVRGVTITSGDLRFENDLVFTEHYNAGNELPRGLALVDDRDANNPRLVAFLAQDGTFYTSAVKPLGELPGRVRVLPAARRTARSLTELEELNRH